VRSAAMGARVTKVWTPRMFKSEYATALTC
jgi:hypothetical protein